uniref:Cep192-like domain-containing protein n=1 Tax=Sphenodon punctatus TaxID=8508 RepID=A0A8D0HA84_SPHPU
MDQWHRFMIRIYPEHTPPPIPVWSMELLQVFKWLVGGKRGFPTPELHDFVLKCMLKRIRLCLHIVFKAFHVKLQLKFISPREPFHIRHFKYSLRPHHYINFPVQFKPKSAGTFQALLVVHTEKCGNLGIQLLGEGLPKE